jgi:Zn-dependent peptidase ImmA (M78 family)
LKRSNLSVTDLKLPVQKWLSTESFPTVNQLEEFAQKTLTPAWMLFLQSPPEDRPVMPHYRSGSAGAGKSDVLSASLLAIERQLAMRQFWLRGYLEESGYEPLFFVGSSRPSEPPSEVAEAIRQDLNVDRLWASGRKSWAEALNWLRDRIEQAGLVVSISGHVGNSTAKAARLDPEEVRGFVIVDDYAPFLFINANDAKSAQLFTLAHELAHVWLGRSASFDLRRLQPASDAVEQKCDAIAAEFLVPEDEFRSEWADGESLNSQVERLAKRFKVSRVVIARRALDCKFVSHEEFFKSYDQWRKEWDDRRIQPELSRDKARRFNSLVMFERRVGRAFLRAVATAAAEESITYPEAYRLTGFSGSTFDKLTRRVAPTAWQRV